MSNDALRALARLTEWPGLIDDGRPDDERVECHLLAGDLRLLHSLLPTLRAALTPPADGTLGEIRARHEAECYRGKGWGTDEGAEMASEYAAMPFAKLQGSGLNDFQMANEVFMADRNSLDLIAIQTAAKVRIRWLSAHLYKAHADRATLLPLAERCAAAEARVKSLSYVNETGVARMVAFLREAKYHVDPIVMSSAVGLYLETVDRAAQLLKDTQP